jgi:uncharacterized protein YndB with AHSA1/START domain
MSAEIRKTIVIDAPPQVVFKALTDEKQLTEWFPNQAILQARVGGAMEFRFQREDGSVDHKVVGKILEIVPGKKLSFSWKNTSDPDFPDTVVTWTLEPAGSKTKVTLVHTGFEKGRWLDLHDGGWSYFIGRLAEYSAKGRVESRQMFKELGKEIRKTVMIDAPASAVFRALVDEKELVQWFPNQGAIMEARAGGKMEFRFLRPDGEKHTFRGKVLEIVSNKKLSYSWSPAIAHTYSEDEVITWTLDPTGDGRTRVTMVHTGLKESKEDVEKGFSYEAGWTHFLNQLVEHYKNKKK